MLYKVTQGSCDRSFGIHVARIADFPAHVVSEAESLANALERGQPLSEHFATTRKTADTELTGVKDKEIEIATKRKRAC
ncbi:unnamed protein product [Hapterophycus canaliculatus]